MTRRPRVYTHCGLRLRTEIELRLPEVAGEAWDVDIRWGEEIVASTTAPPGDVVARLGTDDAAWYTATSAGSGYRLRFHGCGEFVVSDDLSEVVVRPDASGPTELLPILLAGTGTAFLLALRGETVLHASAVSIDGKVLAFVGQSGGGKSTLAALMCAHGADLVGDDVLVVEPGPPATCVGGSTELRLRPAASSIVDGRPDATLHMTADERIAWTPGSAPPGRLSLGAIVLPIPSKGAPDVVSRLVPASDALLALLSVPRVHGWRRPEVLVRDFTSLGSIVNQVPVFEAVIPWGPPFGDEIAPALIGLLLGSTDGEVSEPHQR